MAEALANINAVRTQAPARPVRRIRGPTRLQRLHGSGRLTTGSYEQRSIELFLSGQRLEDSRRFGRPGPPISTAERTHNYYFYPHRERLNNPNVPADPAT